MKLMPQKIHFCQQNLLLLLLLVFLGACATQQAVPEPQDTYSNKLAYLEDRQALLLTDSLMAFDAELTLSPKEQAVNEKLVRLREQMQADYLQTGFFPPTHPFLKSKEHIEDTRLYELFQQMPKGGMLHLHASAAVDFNWLIDKAISMENCYVYWGDETPDFTKGQLHFYQPNDVPSGFVATQGMAREEPGFRDELYDLITLELEEVEQDTFDVWDEFQIIFQRIGGFYSYRPVFEEYNRRIFEDLLTDGVQHVEIRSAVRGLYDLEHPIGSDYYTGDSTIQVFQKIIKDIREEHPQFSLKLIYTSLRFFSEEVIMQELESAYYYRSRYPELIRGFDLVANEDDGNTTLFFLDNWMKMDSLQKAYGVDMPLYLHDGESNWYSVKNLYDAVLLDSKRIGHGFNLNFYPVLQEMVKHQDICLEICPLSNQILGYIKDLRVHPANYLLRRGVQCTISSDDPSIFGYSGISYDYWTIFLAWQLDLQAVKKLAMNSLTYSSLPEAEKQQAMVYWHQEWNQFIDFANNFLEDQ
jgi:adenosine deaminase CECR1